ncbi:hypothetical protein FHL81_13870 [Agrobacterium tumefaciens]|nr:hypothetical protein FHL81_13870 [Agrobacterium tumefaciens]KAB0460446.1 hypothetical protein F7R04_09275 [Agrobacterium tumefaciens]
MGGRLRAKRRRLFLLPGGEKKYVALARSIFLLTFLSRNGLAAFPLSQMTTQILFDRNQFAFQVNC